MAAPPGKMPQLAGSLRRHDLNTMDMQLRTHFNELSACVTRHLHPPEQPPKRVLWDVYCGSARTSQVAEALGMSFRCFSLENGGNFDQLDHQETLLRELEEKISDELCSHLNANCGAACRPWQHGHQHNKKLWWQLGTTIMIVTLALCAEPTSSKSRVVDMLMWSSPSPLFPGRPRRFVTYPADGLTLTNAAMEVWLPVRKSTTIMTTKQAMQNALTLTCTGDHQHCALEGSALGLGPRTKYMEDYQPALASTITSALFGDETPQAWETIHASSEQKLTVSSTLLPLMKPMNGWPLWNEGMPPFARLLRSTRPLRSTSTTCS